MIPKGKQKQPKTKKDRIKLQKDEDVEPFPAPVL